MRVEVCTAASAFQDLRAEWCQVLSQLPFQSVFCTPQWQETWWRHFGATHHLHLLTVRSSDGTLQGLAPLMRSNGTEAPPRLELIGDLELCDYLDVLMVPAQQQALGRALVESLGADGGAEVALCLHNLSQHSPTPTVFHDRLVQHGLTVEVEPVETCPTARLPTEWRRIWRACPARIAMSCVASCAGRKQQFIWSIGPPALPPSSTRISTRS